MQKTAVVAEKFKVTVVTFCILLLAEYFFPVLLRFYVLILFFSITLKFNTSVLRKAFFVQIFKYIIEQANEIKHFYLLK